MQNTLKELGFRFCYCCVCYGIMVSLAYWTYGWQWDYVLATFASAYESADYCFSESLAYEASLVQGAKQVCVCGWSSNGQNHMSQCWKGLFLTHVTYVYGVTFPMTGLVNMIVLIYTLALALSQCIGFFRPGLSAINGLNTVMFIVIIWCLLHTTALPIAINALSLLQQLAIEIVDSELQHL